MKKKIFGILVCIILITTCVMPVYGIEKENNIKKALIPSVSLFKDYLQIPLYKRSLQDIISGKQLQSLTGARPLLVILASYIDQNPNASHNKDYFTDMMWGPRPSISTYYSEVSYGKFTFSEAGVIGWYKINVTSSWAENLTNLQEFVVKVVTRADEDFNFSIYDTNKDGLVSNEELALVIVHPSDTVRQTSWNWVTKDKIITNDDVLVEGAFSFLGEWIWMGVFAHELGHGLGLPDLYDLDNDSIGIGVYGLMGDGCFCGPAHMTAWEKIQLGWLIPTVITSNGCYTLNDVETHPEAFILCDLKHSVYEYFLIENRYRGTSYDSIKIGEWWSPKYVVYYSNLSDEGILISHIDDRKAFDWWNKGWDNVNSMEEHKGVDIECSDSPSSHFIDADDLDSKKNSGDNTDLWDIITYDFDDSSSPCNAIWYDGKPSGCAIHDFSYSGSKMTMNISINFEVENNPPNTPSITGPVLVKPGEHHNYYYFAKDPEKQYLHYYIEWGDGSSTGWIGPEKSGFINKITHSWNERGNYSVRIKAKDIFGAESEWSDPLEVRMPKTKATNIPLFLQRLFQRFPFFEKILGRYYN